MGPYMFEIPTTNETERDVMSVSGISVYEL